MWPRPTDWRLVQKVLRLMNDWFGKVERMRLLWHASSYALLYYFLLGICNSEKSNKMQQCIRIYYSIFIWSSTCFGRHTAHRQEPKNCTSSLWFCVHGRLLDVWLLDAVQQPHVQQPSTYVKPEAASAVFRLLTVGGVSPETCWASIYGIKTNWCHYFSFIYILPDLYMFQAHRPILRRVRTAVHTTIGSVCVLLWPCTLYVVQSTRPQQYRHWANGCVNSCVNSPEDGPVGPKHVEIRQYINKIEIVTSVGFNSICWKDAR